MNDSKTPGRNPAEAAYWTIAQATAWIATRDGQAVRGAPASLSKLPEAKPALSALLRSLAGGEIKASGRESAPIRAPGMMTFIANLKPRREIPYLQWIDARVYVEGPRAYELVGQVWESVLVPRADVQKRFAAHPKAKAKKTPRYSERAVRDFLRSEIEKSGGYLSQNKAAEIVRAAFPEFPRDKAREITRGLTGNEKPGRRGAPR